MTSLHSSRRFVTNLGRGAFDSREAHRPRAARRIDKFCDLAALSWVKRLVRLRPSDYPPSAWRSFAPLGVPHPVHASQPWLAE